MITINSAQYNLKLFSKYKVIQDMLSLETQEIEQINIPFDTSVIDLCLYFDKIKIHPNLLHIYPNPYSHKPKSNVLSRDLNELYNIRSALHIFNKNHIEMIKLYDYLNNED